MEPHTHIQRRTLLDYLLQGGIENKVVRYVGLTEYIHRVTGPISVTIYDDLIVATQTVHYTSSGCHTAPSSIALAKAQSFVEATDQELELITKEEYLPEIPYSDTI